MRDMTNIDRLNLQKMINENDVKDCTGEIREKKHSVPIRKDIDRMYELLGIHRAINSTNPDKMKKILIKECNFLFTNYTDIFNRIQKDELDKNILYQFIDILSKIEGGDIDQHTASYQVGSILKKLYIDSALRKSEKINRENDSNKNIKKAKTISWNEYKLISSER
tara:strand:+ start:175 stop:672 length:498 start_codon:yes stop_codon:yes gene_type:complete